MRTLLKPLLQGILLGCMTIMLPAVAQNPQSPKTKPGGQQGAPPQGGQKPADRPRPGGGQQQPGRPNPAQPKPGQPGAGRPDTGRPGTRPPSQGGPQRPPATRPPQGRPPQNKPPQNRPPSHHRPPAHRPPQWGRPPQNRPSYSFRPDNRDYLRRYYAHRLRLINRARRPVFTIGGYFPYGDIAYLTVLPPDVYGQMPPPPPGYQMGYYDGYVVVYDPLTYFIANVIDLLQ